jgi:hypothetical protein
LLFWFLCLTKCAGSFGPRASSNASPKPFSESATRRPATRLSHSIRRPLYQGGVFIYATPPKIF